MATNGISLAEKYSPNPTLYTNQKHEIFVAESPELQPNDEDCIVHVRSNGICGSDTHFWKDGQIGSPLVESPYVLGHEASGVVVWTGKKVANVKVGDRIAIEPGIPCEKCFQCSTGSYNLCLDVKFSGAPPHYGSIRRYHQHPARYLHKIPDSMSFTEGAFLEPLSVVMHGFERSPVKLGESTIICGAGPIGLIALAVAKASGAFPLVITDIDAGRLKFAQDFVPGCVAVRIQPETPALEMAEIVKNAIEKKGGAQPRVVYECTGVQGSVVTATYMPQPGGEVMVIEVGKPTMNELPFMHVSMAEVDLKFINRYNHSWPTAIRVLSSGYIDLNPLVTHRFELEQAADALTSSADRNFGAVKIHIEDKA